MANIETWIVITVSMTVALSFFSGTLVLARKSGRKDQERFLAAFLTLYGMVKLDQLYLHTGGIAIWPHLAGIMYSLQLFLPALMYFYVRSLTYPTVKWFQSKDAFALLTPSVAAIVASPYYVLSAQQKIDLMNPLTRDPVLYERAILGCQIGLFLFTCAALTYLFLSFKRFKEHTERLQMLFSRIDDKQIDWLRWVILALAFGWTWYALSELWLLSGTQPRSVFLATLIFELLLVGFIAFRGINQHLVYKKADVNLTLATTPEEDSQALLYSRSGLTEAGRKEIAEQLIQIMREQELFKEPELSLRMLSEKIAVSEVRISETFSQHMHTSFFEFVNTFRVEEACNLLKNTEHKILAVGLDAGFNSRSTFSAAFKKRIGQTPSQYRNQHQNALSLEPT